MKGLKTVAIAAITAIAAMAFLGVGSASAVTLCKEAAKKCPGGKTLIAGEDVQGALMATTNSVFTGMAGFECGENSYAGKTTAESASPLPGELSFFKFGKCNNMCTTVTATKLNYAFSILSTGDGTKNGTLIFKKGSGGVNPGVEISCVFNTIKCTFGADEVRLRIEGGTPGVLHAENVFLKREAGLEANCGKEVTWNATFTSSAPNPSFFVSAEP